MTPNQINHLRSKVSKSGGHGFTTNIFANHFAQHVVLEGSPAVIRNFQEKHLECRAQIVQTYFEEFSTDGQLAFRCWADEHFDKLCNGLVPIGQTFPTTQPDGLLETAHRETQRLLDLLDMKIRALNFDFVFDKEGRFFFLELGPRNGGCLIPEVIRYATNVDLVRSTVNVALGLPCEALKVKRVQGFWSSYMVHAINDGNFKSLWLSERIKSKIVGSEIYVQPGDLVRKYGGSNDTLGTMILKFNNMEEMLETIDNMEKDVRVITE